MFVCYAVIMLISFCTFVLKLMLAKRLLTLAKHSSIMEELLTSFGAQYGVKCLGETKLDSWPKRLQLFCL